MSLPDDLTGLLDPRAYKHRCTDISLVETHISWVLLTGEYAYKLKKPVQFSFVDFSTLERRRHFCHEEVRCNRQFAPSLYLGVVAVVRDDACVRVVDAAQADPPEVVEWAVHMRQFPAESQLDRLLEQDALEGSMLTEFGVRLANQHAGLPARRADGAELGPRVLDPARENFTDIERLAWARGHVRLLTQARQGSEAQAQWHQELLTRRLESGWIRECHGDLHLSNLVLLEDGIAAFDCLEFNPDLRWIDPQSDVAFLFMDCLVRRRPDLAYGFLDGYLGASGDYDGVRLLSFYAGYRSMVRAKVAALRRDQAGAEHRPELEERFLRHVTWAAHWLQRPPGTLVLMCGLSGSGKSYLAGRLAPLLPAVRLRSDVARKVLAGLTPNQSARAALGEGLYGAGNTEAVYGFLAEIAADLLAWGEHVIVDATFLSPARRADFLRMAADRGAGGVIVFCDAPVDTLRQRIVARLEAADDPSDAGLDVLEDQQRDFSPPFDQTVRVDTREALDARDLADLAGRLLAAGSAGPSG